MPYTHIDATAARRIAEIRSQLQGLYQKHKFVTHEIDDLLDEQQEILRGQGESDEFSGPSL